jgi:serine/threonine-protein kinase
VTATDPASGQQVPRGTPVTISIAEGPQQVPNVVGLMQDAAIAKLKAAGFNPQVTPDNNSTEPKGTVTGQTPDAGQPLQQGSTVYITVSQYEPSSPPTSSPTSSPPTSPPTSPSSP